MRSKNVIVKKTLNGGATINVKYFKTIEVLKTAPSILCVSFFTAGSMETVASKIDPFKEINVLFINYRIINIHI